jgi:anaerobic magnesium-protoporphyrin IX monomethyl ester cyclase
MNKRILFVVKNLYTMERLGVMQVAAQARQLGWETELAVSDAGTYPALLDRVRSWQPEILAFSAMSPEYPHLESLAEQLHRETGRFVLMGGAHPTFFQDIIERPFIQAVAFGEADLSFPAFLERFADGQDYTGTAGMHFHLDGHIVRNPPAPLVGDLDLLPFPDRDLMVRANPLLRHNRSHIFMAGRGCPNACTYCFNHRYNRMFRDHGKLFRRRSVDHLLREMEAVRDQFGMVFAYIDDDIFTFCPQEWLEEFAEAYPRRVGVPFMVNVHVNFIDEPQIRLLKQAGCEVICFGIECGDEAVSNQLLKRNIRNDKILELARLLRRYGIRFMTQNILALPVEHPLEVDLRTLDLNIRCQPKYAVAHLFYPLPGTELAAYTESHGFLPQAADDLPERTNSYSALVFADPAEKMRVQRLHKLFGLTVSFRWLRPLVPLLIRLPLGSLYSLLFVAWYGFSMRFRLEKTKKSGPEILFLLKSLFQSLTSFLRRPACPKKPRRAS